MKVLSIGSVIQLGDQQFSIAGYQPTNQKGTVALSYVILPYPFGFLNREKVFLCPATNVKQVIAHGYTDEHGERYLDILTQFEKSGKNADYEEFVTFIKEAKHNMAKQEATE